MPATRTERVRRGEGRSAGERCCHTLLRPGISDAAAERLAADLTLIAHPVRVQLLGVLARSGGEVCVCDLEASVPVKQPTVSHHLRILREAGLIDSDRRGQWSYYFINEPTLGSLRERIARGLAEIAGQG